MAGLAAIEGRGVIVTAAGGRDGADVTSRYFAPAYGIPEDPVTGSAHCAPGPLLGRAPGPGAARLPPGLGPGRDVRVEVRGDRVLLVGPRRHGARGPAHGGALTGEGKPPAALRPSRARSRGS